MATTYVLQADGSVQRTVDDQVSFIPADPANRDYQEYLAWADLQAHPPVAVPPPDPDPTTAVMRDLRDKAAKALLANRTFLDLPAPTNAQTLAQVKSLTRQMNGVIRLTIGDLSGTD
jgi:hypothetical protein